ncbi:MAG: tetratricopeptide repeat protein, partial [bacterium]
MGNLGLTAALVLLAIPGLDFASAPTLLTPENRESKILISIHGSQQAPPDPAASDWSITSSHSRIQVVQSERLSEQPGTLVVLDAARLRENDYRSIRDTWASAFPGHNPKVAWVDDKGWTWQSSKSLPSQLPQSVEKKEDSFEAAVFLDWIREILTAARNGEAPLQIKVFTRDFPVPEFESGPVASGATGRSLPRQCLEGVISALTIQPSHLEVINFSPKPGYLVGLARKMGGSATHKPAEIRVFNLEKTYLLTLLTSFRTSEGSLPALPVRPFKIEVRNQDPDWEIHAPQQLWPLPVGIQPPTLSELLEAQQLRPRVNSLIRANDPIQALVLARKIVLLSPFSLSDHLCVLELMRSIGNPDPGELNRSIDEALTLFPGSTELCYQKALISEEDGKIVEAIEWYEKAVKAEPANTDLDLKLARLYARTGVWKNSILRFEKVVGTELESAPVRIEYAEALRAVGEFEKALAQAEVALKLNPDSLPAAELQMRAALDSKKYEEALALARRFLESHPKRPAANRAPISTGASHV